MSFLKGLVNAVSKSVNSFNSFEAVKDSAPNQIGVYIMRYHGKVMYVGRAIEDRPGQSTKGLRKRFQEHWRGAANCKPELHQHKHNLTVSITTCNTVEEAKRLEGELIRTYDTVNSGWNLRYE